MDGREYGDAYWSLAICTWAVGQSCRTEKKAMRRKLVRLICEHDLNSDSESDSDSNSDSYSLNAGCLLTFGSLWALDA